jgi:hypothetical protein
MATIIKLFFLILLFRGINVYAIPQDGFLSLDENLKSKPDTGGRKKLPAKLLHAEPLYIDLIRDLGARKGEKEWNLGIGITDNQQYDSYTALIEYEWAPVNRLGLEIETPFTFYYANSKPNDSIKAPGSRLNSMKLAAQYTFFVNEKARTSMAIGYLHEFELPDFKNYNKEKLWKGNIFNPFLIIAKRWGSNFHSLLYTGPIIEELRKSKSVSAKLQVNTNFHYMITGSRNFIGVEFNKEFKGVDFDMVVRPQMRISLADNFLVGIVTGIPVKRETQRFSSFIRLIYEPGHKIHRASGNIAKIKPLS